MRKTDHVIPFHSPEGTPAEWMEDPFGEAGYIYTGPGKKLAGLLMPDLEL